MASHRQLHLARRGPAESYATLRSTTRHLMYLRAETKQESEAAVAYRKKGVVFFPSRVVVGSEEMSGFADDSV